MFRIPDRFFVWLSVLIGLMVFSLIIYRASVLSVTFDESGTFDVLAGSYADVLFAKRFFQSANNHILNSLLLKVSASLFGTSELALRLPNVLSYIFYFLGSFIICRECSRDNLIRIMGVILFNSVIFVLDFFSLARGYGMATAFELFSVSMMVLHSRKGRPRYLFLSFFFAALSVFANFTWLNFFVPLWAVYNIVLYSHEQTFRSYLKCVLVKNLIPAMFALILFLLSFIPIRYLRMQDEFRWGANGWFDSFHRFAKDMLYDGDFPKAVVVQVLLILMVLLAVVLIARSFWVKKSMDPAIKNLFFITSLILMIVLATVVQRNVLGMMYMDGRKAMMYFPLVVCLVILVFGQLAIKQTVIMRALSVLLSCLAVYNFFGKMNMHSVREWWFDENSKEVAYYISEHPIDGKRDLAVSWYFSESIRYYNQAQLDTCITSLVKLDERSDVNSFVYYYVIGDEIRQVPPQYKPLFRFGWDRILLVRDSLYYNDQKSSAMKEHPAELPDSSLLQERKNMDWTKIPVTNGDLEKQ